MASQIAWQCALSPHAATSRSSVSDGAKQDLRACRAWLTASHTTSTTDRSLLMQLDDAVTAGLPLTADVCSALALYLRQQRAAHSEAPGTLRAWLRQHGYAPFLVPAVTKTNNHLVSAVSEEDRERWRTEMRSRAAHREYATIVADVRTREQKDAHKFAFREVTQQMQIGFSALAALLSSVAVGFYIGRQLYGPGSRQEWLFALASGITLLVVEMALLISRLSRIDAAAAPSAPQAQRTMMRAGTQS